MLVNALAQRWDGFTSAAADTSSAVEHMANIVEYVSSKKLSDTLNVDGVISSFLGANLSAVLEAKEGVDLEKLKSLEVEVEDISTLLSDRRIFQFVIENSLYQISIDNLSAVLEHLLDTDDVAGLNDKHFTTILGSENDELCRHIERNFILYLRKVLIQLEGNTHEEIETIQRALAHEEVSQEYLEEFLVMQDVVFPSLDLIPETFHSLLFEERMVDPTWANLISYLHIDKFDTDVLTKFMQSADEKSGLLIDTFTNTDRTVPMSRFIMQNENFSDDEYRHYVRKLPTKFQNFSAIAPTSRRIILIEEDIVGLTEQVFETAQSDEIVVESLLTHNIEVFVEDRSKYPIDDAVREMLLASEISDNHKLSIIEDVDPTTVPANASMAEKIGSVFSRVDIEFKPYGPDFIRAILQHVKPLTAKISLFNKCHEVLSNDLVRQVIEEMPEPFPDFLVAWRTPRIPNTPDNQLLVKWLEKREIISSSGPTFLDREIKINTFRKPRS